MSARKLSTSSLVSIGFCHSFERQYLLFMWLWPAMSRNNKPKCGPLSKRSCGMVECPVTLCLQSSWDHPLLPEGHISLSSQSHPARIHHRNLQREKPASDSCFALFRAGTEPKPLEAWPDHHISDDSRAEDPRFFWGYSSLKTIGIAESRDDTLPWTLEQCLSLLSGLLRCLSVDTMVIFVIPQQIKKLSSFMYEIPIKPFL